MVMLQFRDDGLADAMVDGAGWFGGCCTCHRNTIEDGTTVISYRGTDPSTSSQGYLDMLHGWSSFTGVGNSSQFGLARTFYGAVTQHDFPSATNLAPTNVIPVLTGHSLGGGLAANDNASARSAAA